MSMAESPKKVAGRPPPRRPPAPRVSQPTKESVVTAGVRFNSKGVIHDDYDQSGLELLTTHNSSTTDTTQDTTDASCSKSASTNNMANLDLLDASLDQSVGDDSSPTGALYITNQLRAAQNQPPLPPPPSSEIPLLATDGHSHTPGKASFMSGIKEKLQDPLSAFIGKIEGLSDKTGILDNKRLSRKADISDGAGLSKVIGAGNEMRGDAESGRDSENADNHNIKPDTTTELQASQINSSRKIHLLGKIRPASFDNGREGGEGGTGRVLSDSSANYPDTDVVVKDANFPKSCSLDGLVRQSETLPGTRSDASTKPTKMTNPSPTKQSSTVSSARGHRSHTSSAAANPSVGPSCPSNQTFSPASIPLSFSGLLSNEADGSNSEEDQFYDPQDENVTSDRVQGTGTESKEMTPKTDNQDKDKGTRPASKQASSPIQFNLRTVLSVFVGVLACMVLPLPAYLSGMILGAFMASACIFTYLWWTKPVIHEDHFLLPDVSTLPPLDVPEMPEGSRSEKHEFKGWMNELREYNESEYHISQTSCVFAHLEGTILHLQTPKHSIPKRAMWDEPRHFASTFVKQRDFDLTTCTVELVPHGLVKKRLWSKKYPICLSFGCLPCDDENNVSKEHTENKPSNIYLFARSSRDKEDWYRHLVSAAAGKPLVTQIAAIICRNDLRLHQNRASPSPSMDTVTYKTNPVMDTVTYRTNPANADTATHGNQVSPSSSMETVTLGNRTSSSSSMTHARKESMDSNVSDTDKDFVFLDPDDPDLGSSQEQKLADYLRYMARVIPSESQQRLQTQALKAANKHDKSPSSSPSVSSSWLLPSPANCDPQVAWINALLTRSFWDFLRERFWVQKIQDKIQKKLSKIHVPQFLDELRVTGIELGGEMPVIRRASKPYLDDRGLWVDLDIAYTGGFSMTLETKCNLMKLTKSPGEHAMVSKTQESRSAITHSDEEDSAESSTDEEDDATETTEINDSLASTSAPAQAGSTSHKILRFVDKISQSKYFQKAAEYKYIKKAMEGVSNTRLLLKVEVKNIAGPLALNIPPPPTDRLWYGFRKKPRLWLAAKPFVGEREVSLSHITDWIEQKLAREFERVFVIPNMDDVVIPLMCDHIKESQSTATGQTLSQETG